MKKKQVYARYVDKRLVMLIIMFESEKLYFLMNALYIFNSLKPKCE